MDKQLRKAKRQQTLLWRKVDKKIFSIAQITLSFSVLSAIIKLILEYYFINIIKQQFIRNVLQTTIALLASIIGHLILSKVNTPQNRISPYKPVKQFAGLYSIEGSNPITISTENGLISREKEIIHLNKLINKYLNNHSGEKCICLIGRSGSGKSTIINLLENINNNHTYKSSLLKNLDTKYEIYNFSDKYDYFEQYLQDELADNYIDYLKNNENSFLFILDQFERFFDLDSSKKDNIINIIQNISTKNIIFLFSLREEFFSRFYYEFNIYDIRKKNTYQRNGIIEYNVINLKENTNLENIVFCQNDEMYIDSSGKINSSLEILCSNAFKRYASIIFNNFKDYTLIQKQIIFNLLKNEENQGMNLNSLLDADISDLMKRYFDVQLCSTNDFFDAARIMYLLSVSRLNNLRFTISNLEDALCVFEVTQKGKINECIEDLHKLQFIKRIKFNNDNEFEIAHDYIASTYNDYASTELKMEVKSALDTYKIEYVKNAENNNYKNFERKAQYFSNLANKKLGMRFTISLIYILSFSLLILNYLQDKTLNIIPFILSIVSINYVYHYYSKIFRFYRKKHLLIKFFYLLAIICGASGSYCDTYWILWFGIGNSINSINSIIISYDKEISYAGKILHRDYGYKTFVMGSLLVFLNIGLYNQYNVVKVVAMSCLLWYSYLSHMNQEYFYTRSAPIIYCPSIEKSNNV